MAGRRTVWTLGYEGHDPESFVATLRKAGVQRVLDVRELPLSRKAGFSKSALAMGLSRHGIAYSHVRALGTPKPVREAYKAGGSFADLRKGYLAHVADQEAAVAELEKVARAERCALLCVEADPAACHRSVLGEVLAERGWRVEHL